MYGDYLGVTLIADRMRRIAIRGMALRSRRLLSTWVSLAFTAWALSLSSASAQVTPAAAVTPPDDTPAIRVGVTLYPTYTFQTDPKITDADGNIVNRNAFDIARAYINLTGNLSHIV